MKYEEAREKIAKALYQDDKGWDKKADWVKETIWRPKADKVLSQLLTEKELQAWKDGGELGVISKDQSLPPNPYKGISDSQLRAWDLAQTVMLNARFRRVEE